MNRDVKLIISDLDGTLLGKDHQLSDYTKKVIRALDQSDVHFWIATGRHHCDAMNIKKQLDVKAHVISSNGATIANEEGELIEQETIPREIVEKILALPVQDGVFQNLYQGNLWLMEKPDEVFSSYYTPDDFKYTLCQFESYLDQPINKVFFTSFYNERLLPIAQEIQDRYGDFVEVTFSMNECLEIMPKHVNKGTAIVKLLNKMGLKPSEVVAFGDGLNDYEMLQVVGKGYVMANAHPKLKSLLPGHDIAGDNDENAVAKWIESMLDLSEIISA